MSKNGITIVEVAKEANVSVSTVSRYLNSTAPISPEKRKAVTKAIKALKYRPSRFAKALRSQKLFVIGVVAPNLLGDFYGEMVNSVATYANNAGYETVVSVTNRAEGWENLTFDFFVSRRVDGIVMCTPNTESIDKLLEIEIPIVAIDWYDPIGDLDINTVNINNEKAAANMIRYLYSKGHRKILVITGPEDIPSSNDRLRGVHEFLRRKKDLDIHVVRGDFMPSSGYETTKEFLAENGRDSVTAIFTFNDMMAFGVIKYLMESGISIPDEISVTGFDNSYISPYLFPSLTTVEQPTREMGTTAAKILIDAIETSETRTGREIILPHKLIERDSVREIDR